MGGHHEIHVHSIHGVCGKLIYELLTRGWIAPLDEHLTSWTPTERGRQRMGEMFDPKAGCNDGSDQAEE